ncbi:MAG: hypothetical protein HUJ25_09030 [Crocinitomicaceae bacterium]|nr:hypothetical protein [Crocinitomicaceae bacterium]
MKRTLVFLCAFLLSLSTLGQETEWQLYASVDGVDIYTKETDCNARNIPAQKAIIIKIVNTTDENLIVEWDRAIWYNGELVTENISDDENHIIVEIDKNSTQEGTCEVPRGALYLYKDFITYDTDTKLTNFELQNLTIKRQK